VIRKTNVFAAAVALCMVVSPTLASAKTGGPRMATSGIQTTTNPQRIDARVRVVPTKEVKKALKCAVSGPYVHGCGQHPWEQQ
jgi:hypothetical protein